jgi:beta-glucanase (GH16 family)
MRRYRSPLVAAAALLTSALVVTVLLVATGGTQSAGSAASLRRLAAGKSDKPPLAGNVKPVSGKSKHGASQSSGGSATASDAVPTSPASAYGPTDCGQPELTQSFNGDTLNTNQWTVYNDPGGSTPRTPQSVTVAGGYLDLIGHYQAPYGYVGGGLRSNINQTYGCWVVRFRSDNGAGYEPVVLLWPAGAHAYGEIDISEVYPGSVSPPSTNRLGGGQFVHIGIDNQFIGHRIPDSVNFSQWQTVAVDWLPNRITMYINGALTWTVGTDYNGVDYIPDTPFHLALQLDEGCTRDRCSPDSSTPSEVLMQVAWVKIYAAP